MVKDERGDGRLRFHHETLGEDDAAMPLGIEEFKQDSLIFEVGARRVAEADTDTAVFAPLEDILLNRGQDSSVRALAAQSLAGVGSSDASVTRVLCALLSQDDLPREVAREALLPISTRFGCPGAAIITRWTRIDGSRPDNAALTVIKPAIAALGRSRGSASGKSLLDLIAYFPPRSEARTAAIHALDARRDDIAIWLKPEALPLIAEAMRSETERLDTMLALIRLAHALGPESGDSLLHLARHPDVEVLVSAAEVLAAFKRVEAIPTLEGVVSGAMSDPRFSPKDGRPDPGSMLARLENAVAALRRAR